MSFKVFLKILFQKPWLLMPAGLSHSLGPFILRLFTKFKKLNSNEAKPFSKQGLSFKNPMGTAGGLDKTANDMETWHKWGAGFLEIGTFTPKAQGPNPGVILRRDNKNQALWNSMGFPNAGFEAVTPKIKKFKARFPDARLFINIGKNRDTPIEKAHLDYALGIKYFSNLADAFVINISSPNTKSLRELHQKDQFEAFIKPIIEENEKQSHSRPLLIKMSPDLPDQDFKDFINLTLQYKLSGWILTNTTTHRPNYINFPKHGGLSGAPLSETSFNKLQSLKKIVGQTDRLIVSVGGILDPTEAKKRLDSGADLIEFYSGLIFNGPGLFLKTAALLKQKS